MVHTEEKIIATLKEIVWIMFDFLYNVIIEL